MRVRVLVLLKASFLLYAILVLRKASTVFLRNFFIDTAGKNHLLNLGTASQYISFLLALSFCRRDNE